MNHSMQTPVSSFEFQISRSLHRKDAKEQRLIFLGFVILSDGGAPALASRRIWVFLQVSRRQNQDPSTRTGKNGPGSLRMTP
jgi:hypothetical protein